MDTTTRAGRRPAYPHDAAIQLVLDGWSIRAVAARFGVSEGAMQYALRKLEAQQGCRLPRAEPGRRRVVDGAESSSFWSLDCGKPTSHAAWEPVRHSLAAWRAPAALHTITRLPPDAGGYLMTTTADLSTLATSLAKRLTTQTARDRDRERPPAARIL
ncbi:MAG: hypothetical protein NVSMB18_12130 [Acetobacteraceae bacterium]